MHTQYIVFMHNLYRTIAIVKNYKEGIAVSIFDDLISDMDRIVMDVLGNGKAIYNGRSAVSVKIDKDAEQFGQFDTQGTARRHEATFLVCEVPSPKRGQTLKTDDGDYKIDGIISNDGHLIRVHINED